MRWRLLLVGGLCQGVLPSLAQHPHWTPKGPIEHHLIEGGGSLSFLSGALVEDGLSSDPGLDASASMGYWSYGPRLLRTAQHPSSTALSAHGNSSLLRQEGVAEARSHVSHTGKAMLSHERRRHMEASLGLGMWRDAQLLKTLAQPAPAKEWSSKEQQEAPLPHNLPVGAGVQEVALPNGYMARTGPADDLDYIFDLRDIVARTKGPLAWLGADVASSIRLSDDRYLWVFGDTFVGTFHMEETRRYEIIYLPSQSFGFARMDPSSGRVLDLSFHWAACPARNLSSTNTSSPPPPPLTSATPIVSGRPVKHKVDDGMAQSLFLYSATKEGDYVSVVCNASDPNQRLDFLWPLSGLRWPAETTPPPIHTNAVPPSSQDGRAAEDLPSLSLHPSPSLQGSTQGGDKARRRHHPPPTPPPQKEDGEPLLLLAVHSSNKSKGGRFIVLGSVAILVANPDDDPMTWRYRVVEFSRQDMKQGGAAAAPVWGASPVVGEDGYTYIFGSLRNPHHLNDQVISRLPSASLRRLDFSELQAWGRPVLSEPRDDNTSLEKTTNNTNTKLHHTPSNASATTSEVSKPLLEPLQQQQQHVLQPPLGNPSWFPINGEGWMWEPLSRDEGVSELSIMYHDTLRLWVKVTLPVFTPMILLWTCPSLTGPWKRHVLYTVPAPYNDLDRYKFYAAKLHPELTPLHRRGSELVVSYVIGMGPRAIPGDFYLPGPPWLYNPQFLRVSLDKLAQEGP